jgi:hypothetical protein
MNKKSFVIVFGILILLGFMCGSVLVSAEDFEEEFFEDEVDFGGELDDSGEEFFEENSWWEFWTWFDDDDDGALGDEGVEGEPLEYEDEDFADDEVDFGGELDDSGEEFFEETPLDTTEYVKCGEKYGAYNPKRPKDTYFTCVTINVWRGEGEPKPIYEEVCEASYTRYSDNGKTYCVPYVDSNEHFFDCVAAFGKNYRCYTGAELNAADVPDPIYEVGCDTKQFRKFGYCAQIVEDVDFGGELEGEFFEDTGNEVKEEEVGFWKRLKNFFDFEEEVVDERESVYLPNRVMVKFETPPSYTSGMAGVVGARYEEFDVVREEALLVISSGRFGKADSKAAFTPEGVLLFTDSTKDGWVEEKDYGATRDVWKKFLREVFLIAKSSEMDNKYVTFPHTASRYKLQKDGSWLVANAWAKKYAVDGEGILRSYDGSWIILDVEKGKDAAKNKKILDILQASKLRKIYYSDE